MFHISVKSFSRFLRPDVFLSALDLREDEIILEIHCTTKIVSSVF